MLYKLNDKQLSKDDELLLNTIQNKNKVDVSDHFVNEWIKCRLQ